MTIEFTSEEVSILADLVEERIMELGPEIHHTRRQEYKEGLKSTREKLTRLLQRLAPAVA